MTWIGWSRGADIIERENETSFFFFFFKAASPFALFLQLFFLF